MTSRRIGILGGTFDPIHHGHLVVGENCFDRLGLNHLLFVPAGDPPHKRGRAISPADARVAMIERAIADNPHFRLSRVDVDRPGTSYSVDMVRTLHLEFGPATDFLFIIGTDSLLDLSSWRDPASLLELCQVVAVNRPGYAPVDLAQLDRIVPNARERIIRLDVPLFDVAASDIRARVAKGRSIRYLVPEAVREYIADNGLYRVDYGDNQGPGKIEAKPGDSGISR